jgi:hypothetical protein
LLFPSSSESLPSADAGLLLGVTSPVAPLSHRLFGEYSSGEAKESVMMDPDMKICGLMGSGDEKEIRNENDDPMLPAILWVTKVTIRELGPALCDPTVQYRPFTVVLPPLGSTG